MEFDWKSQIMQLFFMLFHDKREMTVSYNGNDLIIKVLL